MFYLKRNGRIRGAYRSLPEAKAAIENFDMRHQFDVYRKQGCLMRFICFWNASEARWVTTKELKNVGA